MAGIICRYFFSDASWNKLLRISGMLGPGRASTGMGLRWKTQRRKGQVVTLKERAGDHAKMGKQDFLQYAMKNWPDLRPRCSFDSTGKLSIFTLNKISVSNLVHKPGWHCKTRINVARSMTRHEGCVPDQIILMMSAHKTPKTKFFDLRIIDYTCTSNNFF